MFCVSRPHLLATALALAHATVADAVLSTSPQGVHLAFGQDDDSMVVGYTTLENEASVVEYYPLVHEDGPTLHVSGVSRAFEDGGEEKLVRYVHFATLRGLRAGAAYAYRVGVGASRGALNEALAKTNPPHEEKYASRSFSRWFAFRAKRSKAQVTPSSPLRMLAWCDVGHLESASAIRAVVQEIHGPEGPREYAPSVAKKTKSRDATRNETASVFAFPDAMLHCGDLGYDLDDSNGRNGDAFLRDIEPIAAYVPYMVSAGNHERAYNFSHYKARFRMPSGRGGAAFDANAAATHASSPSVRDSQNVQPSSDNQYYSFDLGPVHVVAWNSEAFFQPKYFDANYARRMVDWLAKDLRSVNRSKTPWIAAHAHRPMYCAASLESVSDRTFLSSRDSVRIDHAPRCDAEKEAARLGIMSACAGDFAAGSCVPVANAGAGANLSPRRSLAGVGTGRAFRSRSDATRVLHVERLLYDHGVDLAFFGHVHDYERYFPVYGEAVEMTGVTTAASEDGVPADEYFQPRATVHVTTGGGGNKEMLDSRRVAKEAENGTARPPRRGRCADSIERHRAAPWCAFTSGFAPKASLGETSDFTFSRVVVRSDAVMKWEQVSAGDPSDGQSRSSKVIDAFTIIAPTHGAFARLGPRTEDAAEAAR